MARKIGKKREESRREKIRLAYYRSNTTLLLLSVMLFQFTSMLVLSLKTEPVDLQALVMALLIPGGTYLVTVLFSRLWPIDRALLIMTLFLCSIGLVTLQDIAKSPITPRTQAFYVIGGIFAMGVAIAFIRWLRNWEKWIPALIILSLIALASPLVIGQWQYGAKNWIYIFGQSIQPSEFVKLSLILTLSAGLSSRPRFKQYAPIIVFAGVLCGLLLAERDLGALLLYFLVTLFTYFVATSNVVVTLLGFAGGAASAVAAYHMFPYVAKRVEMFQNPWSDPLDKGWQIIQALIAIGSGGAFGMGLGLGYPRNIPLYHSDFIFAALSEEFGFIVSLCVLAIYVLIIMRGITVAMSARTSFHALVAFGIIVLISAQTFVHIGGNIKLIPLTGVTLPLISYGGSSMISTMAIMGLLLGVSSINASNEGEELKNMEWREVSEA